MLSLVVIYKTTNQEKTGLQLNTPLHKNSNDMSVLNEDTIWIADDNSFDGGVFRTTNGGQNWTQQFFGASFNPNNIYMYQWRISVSLVKDSGFIKQQIVVLIGIKYLLKLDFQICIL